MVIAGILAYTWLAYPAIILRLGRRGGRPVAADAGDAALPDVAVLLSAHQEEAVIEQRLANLAGLNYPAGRLHVWVGVDGGSDRTAELVRAWAAGHSNVTAVIREHNQGKMAMLKQLVAGINASGAALLVFTDANTMFEADALRHLVRPFADPAVGGVCGRLVLEHGSDGATDEPLYWDTESRIKEAESRLDSCLGANGAIYAIRSELFPAAIADNTIVDDFVIGMKVREQGYRMVFESRAKAFEELPPAITDEWKRRVRIGAGGYQALVLCRKCLTPGYGVFAWCFWSHKVLRWFTPHLMLVAAGGVVAGLLQSGVAPLAGVTVLGGALVLGGVGLCCRQGRALGRLGGYFLVMQAALLVGFLRFCRGGLRGGWERTRRMPSV